MPRHAFPTAVMTVCLLLTSLCVTVTPAEADESYYRKVYDAWTVDCRQDGAKRECSLSATATNGPLAIGLSVAQPVEGDPAVAVALAAYDFETAEVGVRVDRQAPITTVPLNTKVAVFDADASQSIIEAFRNGRRALVSFTLSPSGQRQALIVPLDRFGEALDSYRSQMFLIHPTSLGALPGR